MASLSEFHLLSVLAQEMNMRKAAERLFVSQPALSQRLQNIEKEWGSRLFVRSQKGLSLTPAGEIVIQFVNEVISGEEKVKESIQALNSEVYGTLKIAVASIVGQNWLPQVLKKFVKKYPQAKISLVTGWSSEILKSLYEDHVHIGIIRGTPDWKGVKIPLFKDSLYLVDTEIEETEQILETDRPFIQFKSDSNYYQEIQDWWLRKFKTPPKRTIVVDQIETCKQMTFNGIGYAILPAITLNGLEKNIFKIPLLDEDNLPIKRDTWLLGYESAFQLKQVQAFVELIKEHIEEEQVK
ncbi:LysR family transcriptional regulator [Cytobacillus horneckiae]|uniref:LysR family transcriptional regulator n=1 Tax=Cytobacillus horneckiae TaxID=549687 RepID=A0A2N0Z8Y9_9BACI|nr:LysR family transcriptional regulator [Cytobacillus horneckiae]MCM3178442.1 LysR family transcriptional regulator [Cytobacillus horneckiae]MEC1156820.1 LysR family transcriptional regulator [Cytobacillus horneckiae]MED2940580.1 LysR family transcriptional regulator [Cytobacillus horneckiae]PKG25975.1 LysR family transcriptional regulator [Cytobacillus horneckiae]